MSDGWIQFTCTSTIALPIMGPTEFFSEAVDCVLWARYNEDTGLLWLENVDVNGVSVPSVQLTPADRLRFHDALVNELCNKYF